MTGEALGPRRPLLTFRLDAEQRRRVKARLAREGRTMSEVVTHGLRQYVKVVPTRADDPTRGVGPTELPAAPSGGTHPPGPPLGRAFRLPEPPRLPDRVAARLRELRSSGRS